jgi:hypothetical protein
MKLQRAQHARSNYQNAQSLITELTSYPKDVSQYHSFSNLNEILMKERFHRQLSRICQRMKLPESKQTTILKSRNFS